MSYHVRVKICGVTSETDARYAAVLGADAVGLNFHPPSPRYVDPQACVPILRTLLPFVEAVGVFAEQPLRHVFQAVNAIGGIHTVQWHGPNPELCDAFPFRYIPAFSVKDQASLSAITHYLDLCRNTQRLPSAILLDAHVPGQFGGTGKTAPWRLLRDFRPGVPILLAGGLTPENVAEAVLTVRPYAVDVASGVERHPGQKDPEKIRRFIGNAREAAARL